MSVLFVDVSHHDWDRRGGNLDWAKVRAATSPVMCARATYGDPSGYNPETRHFSDFQDGARAAGFVLRGGYHNLVRGDAASIARQVGYFRRELDAEGCQWAMLDIERYPELVSRDLWPRWEDVCRFRDAWAMVDDRPLVYYLPRWLWAGYYGGANLAELRGPLVASDYGSNSTAAPAALYASRGGDGGKGWDGYGGTSPAIWQYGSQCDVPGASTNTDINAFRGTLAELVALLAGDDDVNLTDSVNLPAYAGNTQKTAVVGDILGYGLVRQAAAEKSLTRIEAALAALAGKDWTDEAAIVSGVLAGLANLTPDEIAAAVLAHLGPDLARQVVAELGKQLAS